MFDTIAAISSGLINQPISIIRLSGPDALTIINQLFSSKINQPNKMVLGFIYDQETKVDEALVCYFANPHSFTGEDMVEIYAHGGVVNTRRILQLLLSHGARQANRGEFSLRAVLNQKMDLVKAEAIHDLIFAQTETQAELSVKKFDGQITNLINNLKDELLTLIATCEVNIDYPEYDDIETLTTEKLTVKINQLLQKLQKILDESRRFKYIFEGINVAIVGQPNSGKSSLLNALLNENKAIVSAQAGTTRDVVEGKIQIDNILLNLKDTAGIHLTENELEKEGISKAWQQIDQAHLVIHVVDGSTIQPKDSLKMQTSMDLIQSRIKNQKYLLVFNKQDLITKQECQLNKIYISAKKLKIQPLISAIKNLFPVLETTSQNYVLNNIRQLALIDEAKNHLQKAQKSLELRLTPDIVIIDLRAAWTALGNILGQVSNETLLDQMFQSFCLGK